MSRRIDSKLRVKLTTYCSHLCLEGWRYPGGCRGGSIEERLCSRQDWGRATWGWSRWLRAHLSLLVGVRCEDGFKDEDEWIASHCRLFVFVPFFPDHSHHD